MQEKKVEHMGEEMTCQNCFSFQRNNLELLKVFVPLQKYNGRYQKAYSSTYFVRIYGKTFCDGRYTYRGHARTEDREKTEKGPVTDYYAYRKGYRAALSSATTLHVYVLIFMFVVL